MMTIRPLLFFLLLLPFTLLRADMESMASMESMEGAESSASSEPVKKQDADKSAKENEVSKIVQHSADKKNGSKKGFIKGQKTVERQVKKAVNKNVDETILEAAKLANAGSPFESKDNFTIVCKIDEIVSAHLESKKLLPAKLCSDAVFVRRVYLDLTGTIPSAAQSKAFIDDKAPDKYAKLVDELLKSDAFSKYFSMLFCDFLRVKAEFPINLWPNAAQAYHRFIYKSISEGDAYDKIVKKILISSGSNFRCGEVNFFRAMQQKNAENIASCVALSFMGTHFDTLSGDKRKNLAAFFERVSYKSTKEWKEEIVFDDPSEKSAFFGVFPDGSTVALSDMQNPREAFAEWLCRKGNPYFARAFSNRVWSWIFGTPIVLPVDDMFGVNVPVSRKLLDTIASDFEKSDFDIRALCKNIVMSNVYRQSSIPQSDDAKSAYGNFAVYGMRQLSAEQLIDSICKISGTSESYGSTTPEPYTTMPDEASAISIPDGSITSSFLELFGKPSRDTGFDAERVCSPSTSQRLHMLNSTHIRRKIQSGPVLREIYKLGGQKAFEALSLSILSRYPTYSERLVFQNYNPVKTKNNSYEKLLDSAWAMLNSEEFLNRH